MVLFILTIVSSGRDVDGWQCPGEWMPGRRPRTTCFMIGFPVGFVVAVVAPSLGREGD